MFQLELNLQALLQSPHQYSDHHHYCHYYCCCCCFQHGWDQERGFSDYCWKNRTEKESILKHCLVHKVLKTQTEQSLKNLNHFSSDVQYTMHYFQLLLQDCPIDGSTRQAARFLSSWEKHSADKYCGACSYICTRNTAALLMSNVPDHTWTQCHCVNQQAHGSFCTWTSARVGPAQ